MKRWTKLGIIAGGGNLPIRLARSCDTTNSPYYVIRLKGYTDEALNAYDGEVVYIAEFGKLVRVLKEQGCDAVVMAGIVSRPNFAQLKPDWRAAALLPKVIAAARRGDGALLNTLVELFEAEGFLVVGAEEVADNLFAPAGAIGQLAPSDRDLADLAKAAEVVKALGSFDVGQAAVVRNGHVLAIEAAEGTDAMLKRCASLPEDMRGYEPDEEIGRRGVLLKRPKPGQELRVDLPTIGIETVRNAAAAGLAGIAIEAEAGLIIDREDVAAAADESGLFVYGFTGEDLQPR
ncbi:UDP-2,3-diacylglucosamine diphosphatase LpxI [Parvularcula flava]|uniref:UDP-2,3-diacylglucosamine diphosphatase LpxI n=1 Tax=Aquisalinus luteolus TaxID=1566827 RepID=A0A8J3A1U2_9PROT|nr:UDP-2,3-diacylglucosamine diphosphatase LpxI [Aquisalinus luteolus]NHK27704.1 UDP-2,3-diacylglucosamine diphosphatase LpxI [Aquisalinus luteolus]GGH96248.1 UDP-2,3-diacylglucosamine pyrophosphatase [Aquisalinus luteolus]